MLGNPQKYTCKSCRRTFYAHTRTFFKNLIPSISNTITKFFKNGTIDLKHISQTFNCSNSYASTIVKEIIIAVNNSVEVKLARALPISGDILLVDETFIKINGHVWYLVLALNEDRHDMAWGSVKNRNSKTVSRVLQDAISRTLDPPKVIITDDFSTYKKAVKLLKYNLIHIRHIHRPPYERIIMDIHKYEHNKLVITSVATINDIFKFENTFITRISKKEVKLTGNKKRGRKKGTKNKKKEAKTNNPGTTIKN